MIVSELNKKRALELLPDRASNCHKGDCGKILLLCGSCGYTGAAALAAMGALRSGAGLVFLGVPIGIYSIEATKLNEPVVFPLPEERGMLSSAAIEQIGNKLDSVDAVLIGPGLGQSEGTFAVTKHVLEHYQGPVVLDADGINVMAVHKDILRGRRAPTILTPHEGEFARLSGQSGDRLERAAALARELGVILLLKGHHTVITDGVQAYFNRTGNPGMAVGGCGDVLAGMIAAFLGQKIPPLEAAACAAWFHGSAGDLCAEETGQYGMLPTDMLSVLPRLLK